MSDLVGASIALPDGRVGIVLRRDSIRYAGRLVYEYTLMFDESNIVDGCTHASYVPKFSIINSARLQ